MTWWQFTVGAVTVVGYLLTLLLLPVVLLTKKQQSVSTVAWMMVIITIPILNHQVPVELPQPAPGPIDQRVTHRLEISASGMVTLDGIGVSDAALPARLSAIRADPNAELTVRTDEGARYDRFAQTLAIVKRAGITRLGFVGHERMID